MSGVKMVEVVDKDDDMRLDRWFKQYYPQVKHGQLEKMLRKGNIRVDGGRVKANHKLVCGQVIRVPPISKEVSPPRQTNETRLSAEDRDFIRELVFYEDQHIIALNKPFGIAVQGGKNTRRHLDGMLDALTPRLGDRPRLAHRLDRDTGGVLILAKSRKSAAHLTEAFKRHQVQKEYWALCVGEPDSVQGRIDMPIAKKMIRINQEDQERMVPADGEDAKKAITDYQVVEFAGRKASFVAMRPLTGRTHQLRVHSSAIGHPIVGDGKYGGDKAKVEGLSPKMHLFCRAMVVPNLAGGRPKHIQAELTGHMAQSWKFFGFSLNPEIIWPELD